MLPLATTFPALAGRIKDVATVPFDYLSNVWTETGYKYVFRSTHDAFIEHLLKVTKT
jgi:hypothetical protein